MKMVMCSLRMKKSRRNGKCSFPNYSMVKCWKIVEVGNERVVRGNLIMNCVNPLAKARLKRP